MIGLIICVLFIAILFTLWLGCFKKDRFYMSKKEFASFSFLCYFFISIGILTFFAILYIGRDPIKKYNNFLEEKAEIETKLMVKPTYATIESAKRFNKKAEDGNSYFYRFNIQDRSDYLIDIDRCLEEAKKNQE